VLRPLREFWHARHSETDRSRAGRPSPRTRLLVAIGLALGVMPLLAVVYGQVAPATPTDIIQHWLAARALWQGENPYTVVQAWGWGYPYLYPLPAAVVALPLAPLPMAIARLVFASLSVAVLAYALTAVSWWPLLWIASGPSLQALGVAQWSPLFTAAVTLPALRGLWIVKPNAGLALAAGYGVGRRGLIVAAILLLVSLAWRWHWPLEWWQGVQAPHPQVVPPILRPGGLLLLLALFRWRRPEARLLIALGCVPQTGALYELVPLGLIPATLREMILLTGTSQVALLLLHPNSDYPNLAASFAGAWPKVLSLIYVPALMIVLARPNVGPSGGSINQTRAPSPGGSPD
jgi:hypothetical protein